MRKGLEKALVLIPLYPEKVMENIGCEIGEAVELLRDTRYRNRVERALGNVAKNHPGSIGKEALEEMNSSPSWYTRWLSVWIMNNMAHESPELVPFELLDRVLKDDDSRVRSFAQRLQNRIERLRVAEL